MKTSLIAPRALLFAACFIVGCGAPDDERFPAIEQAEADSAAGDAAYTGPVCDDGEQRPCIEVYGEHAGIKNCFVGIQTCVEGACSACEALSDAS